MPSEFVILEKKFVRKFWLPNWIKTAKTRRPRETGKF